MTLNHQTNNINRFLRRNKILKDVLHLFLIIFIKNRMTTFYVLKLTFKMILNYHNIPGQLFSYHMHTKKRSYAYSPLGKSVVFIRFDNLKNKYFFIIKKIVLAFKNTPPPLYFCRLFICYVDTHVESHAIKINSVTICSRAKFNLTGYNVLQKL